jgi:hypothetical protein
MTDIKHYVGEVGLEVKAFVGDSRDISAATDVKFLVQKPDGTEVEWSAEAITEDGDDGAYYIRHITEAGDLDQAGTYRLQAAFVLGSWDGPGETFRWEIYDEYK